MFTGVTNLTEKIIRRIDKSPELFGRKILCIGTGPAMARHLAHRFLTASVVCLTDSGGGGDSPEAGAADGLRGPLLIRADADSYSGGLFDTVVAFAPGPLRPASPAEDFPRWERGTLYLRRASLLMEYYEGAASALRRHLRPGGTLLYFVRGEQDEYFLGFCLALAAEEMEVDPASVRQLLCREKGERQILQTVTARACGRTDIHALLAGSLNYFLDRMNTSGAEYEGRDAEILLQADAAQLLRGYHIYQGERMMGKLAVYSSMRNPDAVYYYTDVVGDTPYLKRFHAKDRETVVRHMVGELHRQKAADKTVRWKMLKMHEDWSETEIQE